eukprot:gene47065-2217_t
MLTPVTPAAASSGTAPRVSPGTSRCDSTAGGRAPCAAATPFASSTPAVNVAASISSGCALAPATCPRCASVQLPHCARTTRDTDLIGLDPRARTTRDTDRILWLVGVDPDAHTHDVLHILHETAFLDILEPAEYGYQTTAIARHVPGRWCIIFDEIDHVHAARRDGRAGPDRGLRFMTHGEFQRFRDAERAGAAAGRCTHLWFLSIADIQALLHALFGNWAQHGPTCPSPGHDAPWSVPRSPREGGTATAPAVQARVAERRGGRLWFLSIADIQALLHALFGNTVRPQDRERLIKEVLTRAGCEKVQRTYQMLLDKDRKQLSEIAAVRDAGERQRRVVQLARSGPPHERIDLARRPADTSAPGPQGGGGGGDRAKARSPAAAPRPPRPPLRLRPQDWECAVLDDPLAMRWGAHQGVALATPDQLREVHQDLKGKNAGVFAVLLRADVDVDALLPPPEEEGMRPQVSTLQVPVLTDAPKSARFSMFDVKLVQLGSQPAQTKLATRRCQARGDLSEVCVEFHELLLEEQRFDSIADADRACSDAAREWVQRHGGDDVGPVQVGKPRTAGQVHVAGRRIRTVVVRVRKDAAGIAKDASGEEGVICRDCFRDPATRAANRPVWIPPPEGPPPTGDAKARVRQEREKWRKSLAHAMHLKSTTPHAGGVVCNGRGLGLRAPAEHHEAVQQAVLTEEQVALRRRKYFEIQDVPVAYGERALAAALREQGWEVHPVRSYFPRKRGRGWILGAEAEPPSDLFQLEENVCPVQPAPERPSPKADGRGGRGDAGRRRGNGAAARGGPAPPRAAMVRHHERTPAVVAMVRHHERMAADQRDYDRRRAARELAAAPFLPGPGEGGSLHRAPPVWGPRPAAAPPAAAVAPAGDGAAGAAAPRAPPAAAPAPPAPSAAELQAQVQVEVQRAVREAMEDVQRQLMAAIAQQIGQQV